MNLFHDIDPGTKDSLNVIIEINKGSKNKYELDKETGIISLDRVLHTAQDYPFDYGFVPQTLWDDGDALDVALLTTYPLFPGVLVKARPIALMHMIDSGEADEKIIAVPIEDPRWKDVQDLKDINKHTLKEIEHFFTTMKLLQNKVITIGGFEGKEAVEAALEKGKEMYKHKHQK